MSGAGALPSWQQQAEEKANPNQTMLRFSSNLWILQKINSGDPPFPTFSPVVFTSSFFSPFSSWLGTGVDAPRDAKHDPGILLGLGLSRAGFQEGRSPSQAVVDDRSGALRSGSQRGR